MAHSAHKCIRFHRELADTSAHIYVEVRDEGDHTIYIANMGVTPSFLNKPYDDWCRESLLESYVFASLESAIRYFQNRPTELARHLMEAIFEQVRV